MPLENKNIIDAIGLEESSNNVVLTIIDTTDWVSEEEHLNLIQGKLNAYLRFLESGEITQKYPNATGQNCVISIIAQYKPTENGFRFLDVARSTIEQAGFGFRFELRQSDEAF